MHKIEMVSDPETELKEMLNESSFLVDVRTPAEFSEGNISASVNIPLDQIPDRLAEFKGKDNVIVFCRSGNRSNSAKKFLLKNGIEKVLNGGTWQYMAELLED